MTSARPARAAVLLAGLVGCSANDRGSIGTPAPAPAPALVGVGIVRGDPSPPGAWDDGVVLLRGKVADGDLICSGALVAPNLVLTARHCVSYLVEGPFRCNARGELVDSEGGAGTLGLHLAAADIEIYGASVPRSQPLAVGMNVLSTQSGVICVNDIAFIVLDRPLDFALLPLRLRSPARKSEAVTLVGYGTTEFLKPGQTYAFRTTPRARKSGLTVAEVGPDSATDGGTTAPPRSIVQIGPSGCVGDSGAPLVDAETHAVLGVYSLLDGDLCDAPTTRNLFTHVPSFGELISQAFRAAGATPIEEPASEAGTDSPDALDEATDAEGVTGPEPVADGPAATPPDAETSGGCSVASSKVLSRGSVSLYARLMFFFALLRLRRGAHQRRPSSGSGA